MLVPTQRTYNYLELKQIHQTLSVKTKSQSSPILAINLFYTICQLSVYLLKWY